MTEESGVPCVNPEAPEVELIIRSAYQSAEDLKFTCPKEWTIRQVKENVARLHQSHPAVATQKLIFSGVLQKDELVLANILAERSVVDGAQVFHLVCAQPYIASEIRRRNAGPTTSQGPTSFAQAVPVPAQAPSSANWEQWWEQMQSQTPENMQARYAAYYTEWMNYYYAQQAYAVYCQTFPALGTEQQGSNTQPANNANINAPVAQNLVNNGMVFNAQIPNAMGPVQANVPAANQAARVDILEIFYRLFKVVLLFSAVLLYSSFERFAIVLTAALFIYFVQLRRNNARNRMQQPAAQPAQQLQNDGRVNNNNTGESENGVAGNEDADATDAQDDVNAPQQAARLPSTMQVILATCYSFVTSFFASLVPDNPMPMDIN